MADFYQGRAWIELDRAALRNNVRLLEGLLPPGCALMPAVKANAYGHGAVLIARELNVLGVHAFCVATIFEGIELRRHGISGEILILGYTHPQYASLLVQYHLTQTVLDYPYALALNACGQSVNVHIKIDTGMHRLGERCENLAEIQKVFACQFLHVTGAYTHLYEDDLALSSDKEAAFTQSRAFYRAIDFLKSAGCQIPRVHLLASEGLLHCPDIGGDYARIGIALYGQLSTKEEWSKIGCALQPILSLKARIVLVKNVYRGEGAGYGHQFTAKRDTKIAVVSIGYADGLPRGLSNGIGAALVQGHTAPIAGRICMDQTLLDITDIPSVKQGDVSTFIGKSGGLDITACDIAKQTGTIANEILSRLGERLERKMM